MLSDKINKHRPIPFWSWNDRLDIDILQTQISEMKSQGIGGFIMHARGGLETEYMGEDWLKAIDFCTRAGNDNNMLAFAYDENGWPSGFGDGVVTAGGEKYLQKKLKCEKGNADTERTIANIDGYHFYYEINPHYPDLMMRENTDCFIDNIYRPYLEREVKADGFFTDEPQISVDGYPWSVILPEEYEKEYGEALLPKLAELFFDVGSFAETRIRFWRLCTRLFSENYLKPIYDFCEANSMKLTGHLLMEESMAFQLAPSGAAMPHYRYFHIPGIDMLGRDVDVFGRRQEINKLTPLQVSSVAAQFGKRQILSESFALSGWGIGFDELKSLFDWQAVRGVTLVCNHLQAYSLRGIRKRDYPPSIFYQQPWWRHYSEVSDYFARIGYFLSEGRQSADILLLHPQTSAWVCYKGSLSNEEIEALNDDFLSAINELESRHLLFHLGDESILEQEGFVRDGCIVIGECRYNKLVIPAHIELFASTKRLIAEFTAQGGIVTGACDIAPNEVCDNPNITYTTRLFDDYSMHYFVNSTPSEQRVRINAGSAVYDASTDELKPVKDEFIMPAKSSIITIEGMEAPVSSEKKLKALNLGGEWKISSMDDNVLLLDKCNLYQNGELTGENMHILELGELLSKVQREARIKIETGFDAEFIPERLHFVCETPEIFEIYVNGTAIAMDDKGEYIDRSMRRMDIAPYAKKGRNSIELYCNFRQSDKVYDDLKVINEFEVVKNKFSYTMEIEPMYIVGAFSLKSSEEYEETGDNSLVCGGGFVLSEGVELIHPDRLVEEGYPFFVGDIVLEKKFLAEDTDIKIAFDKLWSSFAELSINESEPIFICSERNFADVSELVHIGENKISIRLTNSLHNLFGPHHVRGGECRTVFPGMFYKDSYIWGGAEDDWTDKYTFIKNGFE